MQISVLHRHDPDGIVEVVGAYSSVELAQDKSVTMDREDRDSAGIPHARFQWQQQDVDTVVADLWEFPDAKDEERGNLVTFVIHVRELDR